MDGAIMAGTTARRTGGPTGGATGGAVLTIWSLSPGVEDQWTDPRRDGQWHPTVRRKSLC